MKFLGIFRIKQHCDSSNGYYSGSELHLIILYSIRSIDKEIHSRKTIYIEVVHATETVRIELPSIPSDQKSPSDNKSLEIKHLTTINIASI